MAQQVFLVTSSATPTAFGERAEAGSPPWSVASHRVASADGCYCVTGFRLQGRSSSLVWPTPGDPMPHA